MNLDLRFYWALFLRRLPVMMLFVLICAGLGVATALKLPDTYSTTARLLVEQPQIPERMVASTVQADAVEQLDVIQQRLMTRANLIDIANRFNVFEDLRNMEPDRVVTAMQEATTIRRSAGRGEAVLMTIGFEGRSPQIVADVVNEYVTLALEQSTTTRINQAAKTLQFFEQEVQRLNEEINKQSAAIAEFKGKNSDALPEDQSYRLGRQTLLQERLSRVERDLSGAESQRREILRVFESTGQVRPGGVQGLRSPEEAQLVVARAELEHAIATYSESSPRVTRLRARIERLEAVVAAQAEALLPGDGGGEVNMQEAMLNATMAEIDSRIEGLKAERDTTRTELDELQQAIARSSTNGIELAALERDYVNIQSRYTAAVNNLNQARMSERVETTAQGQRISVIENANVPRIPSGPNRPKIAIMGLGAGLALAAGFFMLLEVLNRTVRRPAELIARYDITPIAVIPYMESRSHKIARRTGLVTAFLVVLIGVPLALWYVDTTYLPLEILVQKALAKVGLS